MQRVTGLAIVAAVFVAAIASAIASKGQGKRQWILVSGCAGALLGSVWLALFAYVDAGYSLRTLFGSFIGSMIYGAPVGGVVGVLFGLESTWLAWALRWAAAGNRFGWWASVVFLLCNLAAGTAILAFAPCVP